ncbi:MAG: two-component regulator propeller domain-containing protein [Bacteroidota bacterium]
MIRWRCRKYRKEVIICKLPAGICLTLLVLLFVGSVSAQNIPPMTYLGIEQGLSNNSVRTILQDTKGFIWLGTYDGLNRYDGNTFKIFRNKYNDSLSLINNVLTALEEDKAHQLWIGTRQGACFYNSLEDKFHHLTIVGPDKKVAVLNNVIRDIKADELNNVFVGSETQGLFVCENGKFPAKRVAIANHPELASYGVQAIVTDAHSKTYAFLQGKGLYQYDYKLQQLVLLNAAVERAYAIVDAKSTLLIGAGPSLFQFDKHSGSITKIGSIDTSIHSNNIIWALLQDSSGKVWIGTTETGAEVWDIPTGNKRHLTAGDNKQSLTSSGVYCVYEDRRMRKWIGTSRGGIDIFDPQKQNVETIAHDPANPASITGNFVSAIFQYSDSVLWIGIEGRGLNAWNRKKNTGYPLKEIKERDALASEFIVDIQKDYTGDIWLTSFVNCIYRYRAQKDKFEHYDLINTDGEKRSKVAFRVYQDREKNLWATSLRRADVKGALYLFNRTTNSFELYDSQLSDLFCLAEDTTGDFWGGGLTHVIKIDKKNKENKFYFIGNTVRGLFRDKPNELWVATEGGGLILFDPLKKEIVKRYTTDDGLCNNSITAIVDDKKGNLWLSSYNGLSCFNRDRRTFTNFSKYDGLQSNQFNFNAALLLNTGELTFGGIKGLNIFYPSAILPVSTKSKLYLTTININGADINIDNPFVTKADSEKITQLRVPYNDAVFRFEFSSPEFSTPDKIQYEYFMEGWDKRWNHAGKDRTALYTHLNEGTYTFKIKASSANGAWNGNEVSLNIRVLPPWFRSWWAYTIYTLIILTTVYAFYYYRVRQRQLTYEASVARLNADREKSEREKKQAELDRELAEHNKDKAEHGLVLAEKETDRVRLEKENEINERRNAFFTNISHEFRTPLTLIINPVKDLLQNEKFAGQQTGENELNIVYRNARRLLSLVDQLLLFRKAESGVDTLRISRLNFYDLCNEVYLCFVQQAKAGNIGYSFDCSNTSLQVYADREKIEIVLYNLISNALKYTPSNGNIVFKVTEDELKVNISVSDTGCGIAAETGARLFEKFYQSAGSGVRPQPGFGIGLYLVKHFTDQHHGHISYQSEQGRGTTFSLEILKGKDHFNGLSIHEEDTNTPVFLNELAVTEETRTGKQNETSPLGEIVTSKQSMLITDDDEQMRNYIVSIFNQRFVIYEASDGAEGLQKAKGYLPDIIISDIKMEGGDGIDFCRIVKNDTALNHIPVILLTGTPSDNVRLEGVEGGADDYITKPFDKDLLIARVGNLLKSRDNLQKYFYNEITLNRNDLKISAEYKEFLDKCISITTAHLHDERFTVKDLARELGMSHSSTYKKIKEISGQSVNGFIRFIRLRMAAELFINTNDNIGRISFQVGITDKTHFREHFTRLFGLSPADYIKKFRKPFNRDYHFDRNSFGNKTD